MNTYASELDVIKNKIVYGEGNTATNMRANWSRFTAEEQAEIIKILHDGGNADILANADSKNMSTANLMDTMRKTPAEAKAAAAAAEAKRKAEEAAAAEAKRKADALEAERSQRLADAAMYSNYNGRCANNIYLVRNSKI
jgi:flagellar biosynthesis GTPase FlhF